MFVGALSGESSAPFCLRGLCLRLLGAGWYSGGKVSFYYSER